MFGKHAAFIVPSYGITALVILALTVWVVVTYRQRRREIERLEESGAVRRGGKAGAEGTNQ